MSSVAETVEAAPAGEFPIPANVFAETVSFAKGMHHIRGLLALHRATIAGARAILAAGGTAASDSTGDGRCNRAGRREPSEAE